MVLLVKVLPRLLKAAAAPHTATIMVLSAALRPLAFVTRVNIYRAASKLSTPSLHIGSTFSTFSMHQQHTFPGVVLLQGSS